MTGSAPEGQLRAGEDRLLLSIGWTGDVLRVYAGEELIADQFWSGHDLKLDLLPHAGAIRAGGLCLRAFAWDPRTDIHVDPRVRPQVDEPVLDIHTVRLRRRRRSVGVRATNRDARWDRGRAEGYAASGLREGEGSAGGEVGRQVRS